MAIAGGGPAGMMLAAELALAGVDVAILERRPDHVLVGSRAGGFHSRTIEVAARALRHTMAQTVLQRGEERIGALVEVVSELAVMDEPRRRLAGILSGLDIHYDLGEGHVAWVGDKTETGLADALGAWFGRPCQRRSGTR